MNGSWKSVGDGAKWLPVLNDAENNLQIPADLLARMAFQESSFRPEVIKGLIPSSCGALGILQLRPRFFKSALQPTPFSYVATLSQIAEASRFLKGLYGRFKDWQEAVAAYNWGEGNEHHSYVEHGSYILADMPAQTQNYVREVFADVPIKGALLT